MATTNEYILQGTATDLLTTELGNGTGLAAGAFVTSSVGGTAGAFNNVQATTNFNGYPRALLRVILAAPTGAFAANSALYLWFLKTIDGGATYEDASANPRPPDVIVPIEANGNAQNIVMDIKLPPGQWKVQAENVQGSSTQALAATGNKVTILPYTLQQV